MALTERLMVLLDAHAGGLISEFTKAAKAADKVGDSAKGAKKGVEDIGAGADKTSGLLGKIADKAGISSTALKVGLGAGGVAAVGALATAAVGALHKFEDLAGEVDDFQDVAGGTAEQASRLVNVTKSLGIAPEVAGKAFFTLGKNIGDGKSKLADFGIEVAKNKDGTTDLVGTLGNVSAAYQGTADQAEKNAIAAAAFGKAGAGLPDLLSLTRDELEALGNTGPVFSQEDVDNAKALQIQLKQVGLIKDKLEAKGGGFLANLLTSNLGYVKTLSGGLVDLTNKAEAEKQTTIDGAKAKLEAAKEAAAAQEQERKDTNALRDSLLGVQNAEVGYERSIQSVGDAERNAAEKRKALNDLMKKGAVDAKAVETATRNLDQANRSLATAQDRAAAARKALDDVLAGPSARTLGDAQLDVRDATVGVADAQANLVDAQKAVNDAQKSGDPTAVADANRQLEHASIDLTRSQERLSDAQQAVVDLNPDSEAGAKRVAAAYLGVRDANQAVDESARGVLDATKQLNTVQAGDPDFADKIATAYLGVRDANNQLADAKRNELGALIDLNDKRYQEAALLGASGDAAARLNSELGTMAARYPALAPLLGQLLGMTGAPGPVATTFLPNGRPLSTPSSHAMGGRVRAGETSWVGERGPELVTFGASGYVTPNHMLGGGGGTTNIYVQSLDPAGAGKAVVAALREYNRNSGPVPVTVRS
jgi:hypothetical protein